MGPCYQMFPKSDMVKAVVKLFLQNQLSMKQIFY